MRSIRFPKKTPLRNVGKTKKKNFENLYAARSTLSKDVPNLKMVSNEDTVSQKENEDKCYKDIEDVNNRTRIKVDES